jgi:formylglycine-generating enzyme required for sulfatase activity
VMRGGSWADTPRFVRTSNRDSYEPTFRFYVIGFRLVLSPR